MAVEKADLKFFPMSSNDTGDSDFVVIYQGFRDGTWTVAHDEDIDVLTYDLDEAKRVAMNYRHAGSRASILPAELLEAGFRTDGELVLTEKATHAIPIEILSQTTGRSAS